MQNMDFWFFWKIFKTHWRIIVFIAFVSAILTGVYNKLFIKPVYQSCVTLYFGRLADPKVPELKLKKQKTASRRQVQRKLSQTSAELAFGVSVSGDYRQLIHSTVIRDKVRDEIRKSGRWQFHHYRIHVHLLSGGRVMNLQVLTDDPGYSQAVATSYGLQFIEHVKNLIGVANAQMIEDPTFDPVPVNQFLARNMGMGFAIGFIGCFAIFVLLNVLNRSVRTAEEIEAALNVPVIGTVHRDRNYVINKHNPLLFSGEGDPADERNRIAEDFRVFRVNLINRKPAGKQDGSVIAVTSAQAKEGKTFCTANLGAALAEAGYKVLLIDCDTGRRGLQSNLGNPDDIGLMNILSEEVKFEDAVKHNMDKLKMDVLFCGNPHVNSANLMVSPKFKVLIEKLKKKYDYTFLDISCHLGTADIVSAGSTADSILLLVRAGKTRSDSALQTVEALKRANLEVSGVVLNGVDPDK